MTVLAKNARRIYLKLLRGKRMRSKESFSGYKNKLIGRLYGLLCEREKNGEWEKFVDTIQIEILGFNSESINYWSLLGKIGALKLLNFDNFRKTIFECIHLIGELSDDELH